ncbi:hypothetical protein M7I_4306 [Glarea lozoyensis 74030]|uniref:Uncharacterized protein n=1 Tax=Glarea lozoyensis (strain ATCC 74030 / MF5533) TaxID=1104152 RepID=H0ENU3_GLAL7|nr:hypothetical protein M7I_4306 [Glarea lozoyensis 74030]
MAPFMQERELPGNYICGYQDGESILALRLANQRFRDRNILNFVWYLELVVVSCCDNIN